MEKDIFSKRFFTCFSCLFETKHNWYSIGATELASLPLAVESQSDIDFYEQLDNSFFEKKILEKMLDKKIFFTEQIDSSYRSIPNLNLCSCSKCNHNTLWFGKLKIL